MIYGLYIFSLTFALHVTKLFLTGERMYSLLLSTCNVVLNLLVLWLESLLCFVLIHMVLMVDKYPL